MKTAIRRALAWSVLAALVGCGGSGSDNNNSNNSNHSGGGPGMAVSPTTLTFSTIEGTNPSPQSVGILNGNAAGTLAPVTATPSSDWMTTTVSGSGNAQTVVVHITAPAAGTYSGSISIASPGADNTPVSVAVSLTVTAGSVAGAFQGTCNMQAIGECWTYWGLNANNLSGVQFTCTSNHYTWSTTDACPTANRLGTCKYPTPSGSIEVQAESYYSPIWDAAPIGTNCVNTSHGTWTPG